MKNKEEVVVVKKMEVPLTLLMKLGSAAVHCEELFSEKRHKFDLEALKTVVFDKEVQEFLKSKEMEALLPVKR
jgi:hypothetical protein